MTNLLSQQKKKQKQKQNEINKTKTLKTSSCEKN